MQNRSSAVMAQRVEPHDSLDFFPTPPWATRALVEKVLFETWWPADYLREQLAWDPACGQDHMMQPLSEYFREVIASDVFDYGHESVHDFLMPYMPRLVDARGGADWVITNPPFRLGAEFVRRGLEFARIGVAMLVRTAFLESVSRYKELFQPTPPKFIAVFTERVIMAKGIIRDPDIAYLDEATGKWKRPSTATSYAWLVWCGREQHGDGRTEALWIPPCRKELTRPGDYDLRDGLFRGATDVN